MDFIRLAEQFVAKDAMGPTGRKRYPEVWSDNHLATAKNDYKCNHCDQPIKTGDKYFRWEWKTGNPVRSHEHHRQDPKSMTKGLDSSEAMELLKDLPVDSGELNAYKFEGLNKAEVKGERTPEQIHSAGQVVNIPGDDLGPLERAQRPALELKPGTMKKAMVFVEKDLSSEGQKQLRNTTAREQRIKDWAMPEYERRERDQARREARKHKQSMRGMQ